jgi:hypothetical protein
MLIAFVAEIKMEEDEEKKLELVLGLFLLDQ